MESKPWSGRLLSNASASSVHWPMADMWTPSRLLVCISAWNWTPTAVT